MDVEANPGGHQLHPAEIGGLVRLLRAAPQLETQP